MILAIDILRLASLAQDFALRARRQQHDTDN